MTRRLLLLTLVAVLVACDQADEAPINPGAAPDGVLDCETHGMSMETVSDFPSDAVGRATVRLAAMSAASELLEPGDAVVEVDDSTFSIVRAGKEVCMSTGLVAAVSSSPGPRPV